MHLAAKTDGIRPGTITDPHIVELGKLMLARAQELGVEMADLLCREIEAYRDGTAVADRILGVLDEFTQ